MSLRSLFSFNCVILQLLSSQVNCNWYLQDNCHQNNHHNDICHYDIDHKDICHQHICHNHICQVKIQPLETVAPTPADVDQPPLVLVKQDHLRKVVTSYTYILYIES